MTALAVERRTAARRRTARQILRTDIQALRAVAVMSVVLFHLWPDLLPGGFVGVDVFFVISGYLITGHLVREVERTGRLRLGRFWAARARRLLPASLLTLLLTAVAVVLLVPRSLWDQFLSEVVASASYVQNWLLAGTAVDYLAADKLPSPAQHFWSLSVEEQFYAGLPVLIVFAVVIGRLFSVGRTRAIATLLAAVTIESFAYSLHLTATDPGVAYFSTFTRVWEFGLGGLAAFAMPAFHGLSRQRALAHTTVTLAGAAAIIASFFVIDSSTPFPGIAAALPVLGTLAVVRWGGSTFATIVGARQPVAMLGRISYALYLWHWPLIILLPYLTLRPLTPADKLVVLALAVTISWASTRLVEEPLRFTVAPRLRARWVFLTAAAAMVPVLVIPLVAVGVVDRDRADRATETTQVLHQMPACLGAASMDPAHPGCVNPELEDRVVPAPADALLDRSSHQGCGIGVNDTGFSSCSLGPEYGYDLRVAAVGDSHNRTLVPAYEWMAEKYNWRIDVASRAGCYWTTADHDSERDSVTAACAEWRSDLAEFLGQPGRFDAVITTHATAVRTNPESGETYGQSTVRGMVEAWTSQIPIDVPIVAILDNPRTQPDNTPCVDRFGTTDPDRCATPRHEALEHDWTADAVAQVAKASLVDMTAFYCRAETCPSVIGGVMVYRDRSHLTATYVRTLAPYLGPKVAAALSRPYVTRLTSSSNGPR